MRGERLNGTYYLSCLKYIKSIKSDNRDKPNSIITLKKKNGDDIFFNWFPSPSMGCRSLEVIEVTFDHNDQQREHHSFENYS